jgi:sporulation protein YlmC with PRC-barrel domain
VTRGIGNRLEGPIDGALHLLDRQVIDVDGRLVCKVDDVELTDKGGRLAITSILAGPPALLARIGGRAGKALDRWWVSFKPSDPHRSRPWRLDIAHVDRLDSAVHLSVPRDGAMRRDRDRRRLGQLTGMSVHGPDGDRLGRVLDVRFEPDSDGDQVMRSLIVGHGRPGSLLGYDRRSAKGPTVVRVLVRALHRHTAIVPVDAATIMWDVGVVRLQIQPSDPPGHPFGTD